MTRLLIDLPEELDAKLRERAVRGGYSGAQEYVRALIETDAEELRNIPAPPHSTFNNKSELEKLLVEGIESSDSREITTAEWDQKRRELRERHSNPGSL